ncbi:hypothetical protein RSOL_073550, partial [Rhizoctonia solani AG-3 Rhs1AP]
MAQNAAAEKAAKKQMKQMKKDIFALQQRAMQAEEAQQRAEEENQALKTQLNRRTGPSANNAEGHATNRLKLNSSETKAWKKRAKLAGSPIYWEIERFATPGQLVVVRDVIYHMSKSPGPIWLEDWFQQEIHEGARKGRSAIVHSVQAMCDRIFGIAHEDFEDRLRRPNLPRVIDLRNFLHLNEKNEDGSPDLSQFFRDVTIVRVLRLMLYGKSAINTGKRSSKARKCYSKLWHITRITPSLLAFAATIIHFVLSGDPYFEEGSGSINYSAWFHARLRLLEAVYDHHRNAYNSLMKYYNKEVLGINNQGVEVDDHGDVQGTPDEDVGMDVDDLEFLENLGG